MLVDKIALTVRNKRGKEVVVAWVAPDDEGFPTLVKSVKWVQHHLRIPGAWAMDRTHIDQLENYGGQNIRLYVDNGRVWETTVTIWRKHAEELTRAEGKGYEPQEMLRDRYWTVHKAGEPPKPTPVAAAAPRAPEQGRLL